MNKLHEAAAAGDDDRLRSLLSGGWLRKPLDANSVDEKGRAPLHYAARQGSEPTIILLLSHGAHVDARASDRGTPLHDAAEAGHEAAVLLLLSKGGNLQTVDVEGYTPLHRAVRARKASVVRLLLIHGANPNAKTEFFKQTPLHIAADNCDADVAFALIERGADINSPDSGGMSALYRAAQNGCATVVELLLAKGAYPFERHELGTALFQAASAGHTEVVKILLDQGAGGEREPINHLFSFAVGNAHPGTVELLLAKGADANTRDQFGSPELHTCVFALGYNKINLNSLKRDRYLHILSLLLEHNADPNLKDKKRENKSALAIATAYRDEVVADILKAHGALL